MRLTEFSSAASFAAECVEDGNTPLARKVLKQLKSAAQVHIPNETLREAVTEPAALGQPSNVLKEAGRIKAVVDAHLWKDEFCR